MSQDIYYRALTMRDGSRRLTTGQIIMRDQRTVHKTKALIAFSKLDLIQIAWRLGIVNPDGFSSEIEGALFAMEETKYCFPLYLVGWHNTSKEKVMRYVWNYLLDHGRTIKRSETDESD